MTSVSINRTGTDTTELEMITTGSDEASVVLTRKLLDGSRQYHFAVTELSVPLGSTPMFPDTQKTGLFTILRRNVGESLTDIAAYQVTLADLTTFRAYNTDDPAGANYLTNAMILQLLENLNLEGEVEPEDGRPEYLTVLDAHYLGAYENALEDTALTLLPDKEDATYSISPSHPFYDCGDFVKDIMRWINVFNQEQSKIGIEEDDYGDDGDLAIKSAAEAAADPYPFLTISLSADGSLLLKGSQVFWNNFIIQFSAYGARLLGLNTSRLTKIIGPQGERHYLGFTNNQAGGFYNSDANDQILAANNTTDIFVDTATSIFQSDLRVKVSVESHLPTASNLVVRDEKETVSRDIAEAYFLNHVTAETEWDENGDYQGTNLTTDVYSGQRAFIKKSDRHTDWTKLLASENLSFFRFHLKITYRVFDLATQKFKLRTSKFNVPDDFYWLMVIKFVSDE